MRTFRVVHLSLLASVILVLNGCVYLKSYPSSWSRLSPKHKVTLEGQYQNVTAAEATSWMLGYSERNLSSLIFDIRPTRGMYPEHEFDEKTTAAITHITITEKQGLLEFSAWKGNELVRTKSITFGKAGWKAVNGGICRRRIETYAEQAGGVDVQSLYLTKSEDGSLVVREGETCWGLAIFIPVAGMGSGWVKFAPYIEQHE